MSNHFDVSNVASNQSTYSLTIFIITIYIIYQIASSTILRSENELLKLFITRHGETIWNTQKRLQGWKDSDLTENGINNALLLGNRLKDIEFTSIYTSPSKRTLHTAHLIIGDRKQPIIEDEDLREINLGDWEGQTQHFLMEKFPEEFYAFWNAPHLYTANSGENFIQLQERVNKFLNRIIVEHDSGNLLIVTHSVFIKMLLANCKSLSIEELWSPLLYMIRVYPSLK